MDKIGIIYQGRVDSSIYFPILEQWAGLRREDVVFSSWEDNESTLRQYDVNYVLSKYPDNSGPGKVNYQIKSTLAGIRYFKEKGYSHVIKIRSDMVISDIDALLSKFPKDKLMFCAYHTSSGGYLCDYMSFGDISSMEILWDIPCVTDKYPEYHLTKNYLTKLGDKKRIAYILPILFESNIKCYWTKYGYHLNDFDPKLNIKIPNNENCFIYDKFI